MVILLDFVSTMFDLLKVQLLILELENSMVSKLQLLKVMFDISKSIQIFEENVHPSNTTLLKVVVSNCTPLKLQFLKVTSLN